MSSSFDICIRGAGIVGRTLALLLARNNLRIALVAAPATTPLPDVRAYALNTVARDLLESVRCWPDACAATAVHKMQVCGDAGGQLDFDAKHYHAEALTWIVDVPVLEAKLAEAVKFQPLIEIFDAPQDATLTIVCEGRSSATRQELGVEYQTRPYSHHAIAARLQCEKPHAQIARQWFTEQGILAFLPLDGPQGNSVGIVWSIDQHAVANWMALCDTDFAKQLEPISQHALGALQLSSNRVTWPLQLSLANRWTGAMPGQHSRHKSWVLAGDSAHAVHPLSGQGLNLGLADVAELVKVLCGRAYWRSVADPYLLRQYERARKAGVAPMQLVTDSLQMVFTQTALPWQLLRNWGMNGFEHSGPIKTWMTRQAMGNIQTLR